jgi:hypothetical protein
VPDTETRTVWLQIRRSCLLPSASNQSPRSFDSIALKATEANRKRGPGTREKVRSKRINLEGNTHTQEINVSQLPV